MKKALIVCGGWVGHEPAQIAQLCEAALKCNGFAVEVTDSLDAFLNIEQLKTLDLIVPTLTMADTTREQLTSVLQAVQSGVGIAGCHGGMIDAFHMETEWQFMVGAQWMAHPGDDGRLYTVNIIDQNPITAGLTDYAVRSEMYYMLVDPAMRIMATTTFADYNDTIMPVTWTKTYGKGRVFCTSLGHHADIMTMPQSLQMLERGMLWAAGEWQTEIGVPFAKAYSV
jgi:uncharacterized protein